MRMIHIDWLSIYEDHPADVPVCAAEVGVWYDWETGAVVRETTKGLNHRGSFSSSVYIRARGSRVEVSGNPSKWGRPESVFGLATVAECIAVYNGILETLGLPPFSLGRSCEMRRRGEPSAPRTAFLQSVDQVSYQGPRITRIDLTENFGVGQGNVAAYQAWLTSQSLPAPGPRRQGNMRHAGTVHFGGSAARVQTVCYEKGPELRAHLGDVTRRLEQADREGVRDYLLRLAEWCDLVGLVRWEVRFGRKWLSETGAHKPEWWYRRELSELVKEFRVLGHTGATVIDWRAELEERLVADGMTERQAGRIRDAVLGWLAGAGRPAGVSDRTWRRYAQAVRPYGINLNAPLNVVSLPVRVREVRLSSLAPPEFYGRVA